MVLKSQDSLQRHLALEGSYNIRDIGGYATLDGRHTCWRTVLRADSLHKLTPVSQQAFLEYIVLRETNSKVLSMIDLRRTSEAQKKQNVFSESPDVIYRNIPFFDDEILLNLRSVKTLLAQYCLLLDSCQDRIREVMEAIAQFPATPVVVHCAAGKDRTGIIIALLLSVANVPAATISEDYALSEQYLAPLFAPELPHAIEKGYAHIFECRYEIMLDTIDYLDKRYGGAIAYLDKIGITNEQIDRVRAMLVA